MRVTDYKISPLTKRPAEDDHELIFGYGMDEKAREDGLLLPVTIAEHNDLRINTPFRIHGNPMAENLSRLLGQVIFEKNLMETGKTAEEARQLFYERYGKTGQNWNWL